ncbi:V-type ATP synthase subunit I [Halorientalis litorea]|jgi:V/A-type H+-transporting ATPase subunit I|uniref:V-type ATP synthase subunit I n=1 Tax=Halorientalis litorea TaxID=2931977 RepID=UPI001FF1BD83|nr:V-type ATP synthase subunit I [Halorientalis litorea]
MLRPEQMSRVSVTGSRHVMEDVIETIYDLRLVDVTDYSGGWDGFEPGSPIEGGDEASSKLVTVRALKNTLGVDEDDAGPTRLVTDEAIEEELDDIRQNVNELDDRRDDVRSELRDVEERIDSVAPFAQLNIDLDLLSGYDSLSVAVGEGDAEAIRRELLDADEVAAHELFSEGDAVAVFVHPTDAAGDVDVQDVLVGTAFQAYPIPDAEGSPEEYISELRHRKQQLETELETVESELENLKLDVAGFLLAAEEKLAIEAQKAEAPLSFATTENAFVAEGWIPTDEYADFADALSSAVGGHVEVEELERADYDSDGHATHSEPVHEETSASAAATGAAASDDEDADAEATEQEAVADGGAVSGANRASSEPRSDGGAVTMSDDEPPVIQDNPGSVKPFEALVEVINRPKYSEFDPTIVLFLTFPAFFGFMIGDLGYGLLYLGLGYWLYSSFENEVIQSLGGVGMWAGGFTALFGVLYGEFFGLHQLGEILFNGHPPIHKGLQPHYLQFAQAWLTLSLFLGLLHVGVGYVFDFVENLSHGLVDAVTESGSWVLLMFGIWGWVFSTQAIAVKPTFMFTAFAREGAVVGGTEVTEGMVALPAGFTGFSPTIGTAGLVVAGIGFALLLKGEGGVGALESLNVLVNVLSYTRIAAVLLAKAGMALAVNLIVFGATFEGGEFHFITFASDPHGEVVFSGLLNASDPVNLVVGGLFGILILVLGHALVLALGITSAGLQAVRLEYVEFFGKFYEGGGRAFEPFGYEREYTAED